MELLITSLERSGIAKEKILAVPLNRKKEQKQLLDSIHHADGISLFDGAVLTGTVFMVFGVIYGFVLKWGPILWGLIGLAVGGVLGLVADFLIGRRRWNKRQIGGGRNTEVILIIHCEEGQQEKVKEALLDHSVLVTGAWDPTKKT